MQKDETSVRLSQRRFFTILGDLEIDEIHQAGLDVLESTGIVLNVPEALSIYESAGAKVDHDQKRVWIPRELVKENLRKAPSNFKLYSRTQKHNWDIDVGHTYFCPGTSLTFIIDLDTGLRRQIKPEDQKRVLTLVDGLENIDAGCAILVPQGVPPEANYQLDLINQFKYTTKMPIASMWGKKVALDNLKIAAIVAGGEDELRRRPNVIGSINPVSPLQQSPQLLSGAMEFAKKGIPFHVSPEIMAGGTGPVTIAGTLVQQHAEILSVIVLAQLIRPGTPVFYGTVSTIMDMRTGGIALGSIETGLINIATAQMGRHIGLPTRGTGGQTDSKTIDMQAGYETALTLMLAASSGINFIGHAAGTLEGMNTASYEKYIIDNEICGMVKRATAGIRVDEKTLSVKTINRVGPGGNYLSENDTREMLRQEHFIPKISDKRSFDSWYGSKNKDLAYRANIEAKRIIKEHTVQPMDAEVEKQLDAFWIQLQKRASG